MDFGENNRISHRQLYCQIVTAFAAPFLLCLFGRGKLTGLTGLAGTAAGAALLLLYVIFLIRLVPFYASLKKSAGPVWGRIAGIFLLSYVILAAAYLLDLLETIVPESLTIGVPGWVIPLLAVLVCSVGSEKGMQRRGRIAGVSGWILLAAVLLLMALSLGQAKISYLQEMTDRAFSMRSFAGSTWGVLCAFAGLGLLPFSLEFVQNRAGKSPGEYPDFGKRQAGGGRLSAGYRDFGKRRTGTAKVVAFAILTLAGIVAGMELLLPAVLGQSRTLSEEYPVLPLLAGADLPGNVLARFDVLWMGFLLFGLLFAIGSLFFYGHQIVRSAGLGNGRFWMAALAYLLSFGKVGGLGIADFFENYLMYFWVPGLLIFQSLLLAANRGRRRKRPAAAVLLALFCAVCLTGCGGIEPEKRMYPLALGIDAEISDEPVDSEGTGNAESTGSAEGLGDVKTAETSGFSESIRYTVTYGVPDLPQTTGQDKSGDENKNEALSLSGASFAEIEALYAASQEKYLDMGHIQVLVLGKAMEQDGLWQTAAEYLLQEAYAGENIWVFCAENAGEALNWQSPQNISLGEYLGGLLENRTSAEERRPVTLRELYHALSAGEALPVLPEIILEGDNLRVEFAAQGRRK